MIVLVQSKNAPDAAGMPNRSPSMQNMGCLMQANPQRDHES